jgi:hypothetical protein
MEKLIYREEQSFGQSFVPWLMLVSILILVGGFCFAFYQQLYLGKPYGDTPMSNNGLIWSSILSFIALSAVFIFILKSDLITEIWTDGIRFKFPPIIRKMKHIPLADITSVKVARYNPIMEFGGWGWRKRLMTRKTAYNVKGRMGIRVIKKDGTQVMFGTQKQAEMERAVAKMMQPEVSKY